MMNIFPTILAGHFIRLEPISVAHVLGLTAVGQDENIWRYLPYGNITTESKMLEFVNNLLKKQKRGTDLPFAVIHLESGNPIGCTRYLEIKKQHHGLEIGGTWYSVEHQGTAVNPECKYLLLQHAFETLGCIRVQLKTDARNKRSQRAIERLGAVREGVFRNHIVLPDGAIRDSVYYSIINTEWPSVKMQLGKRLSTYHYKD